MGFGTLKFKSVVCSFIKPYQVWDNWCETLHAGHPPVFQEERWQRFSDWMAARGANMVRWGVRGSSQLLRQSLYWWNLPYSSAALQLLFSYSSATPPLILACDFSWNLPHAILIHFDPFWTRLLKKTAQWLEESLANALQRKMHMHVCLTIQIEMLRNKACIWGEGENREREWHAKASADLLGTEVYWACFSFRQQ